ncbi:MFS transporter [Bifidobacterium choerinum]|uniref:MFS transporter n=1 Tax=Bifidobacterium choerinum TaxID=35760 RepID=A0A087ADP3_9BIFI|nr:MFS transporter [Bifidobacterium choerinum]ATU20949.1 MFS transporter [Bifidobacterium choerinum]KFI56893.1 transporter, putative fucose permease [Bifidobacterium choerinum]
MTNLLLAIIYLAFISLGLPDGLLGAAWPTMSGDLDAPLSWAGGISMVISAGTIVSALMSDRLTLRFGAGRVTAASVGLTALALFGFSLAPNYWTLLLMGIPYGLGAGGVDAALNNYVAVHYASRHMSWLHCMWGVGALLGPYMMGFALSRQYGWQWGYRSVGVLQVVLTVVLIASLPLWRKRVAAPKDADTAGERRPIGLAGVLRIRGAAQILIMFFCYCSIEQTTILWASSYMAGVDHVDVQTAASYASLVFIGITVGRFVSGFVTMRLSDAQMIRLGAAIIVAGIVLLALPVPGAWNAVAGFVVIGLGCAPVYPCIIHATPAYFGADKSQAIVGVQMASAYVGTMLMPPLFGLIAQHTSLTLLPWYLLVFTVGLGVMHEWLRALRRDSMHAVD